MSVNYPENLKKTMPRLAIFEILKNSGEPLTASDIYKLTEKQNLKVNFSTIYRTLNAFEKANIIVQHNLPSGGEAVFEIRNEKHCHYAICLDCKKKIPLNECPVMHNIAELDENNFEVTEHHVELFGYCKDCRLKHDKKDDDTKN